MGESFQEAESSCKRDALPLRQAPSLADFTMRNGLLADGKNFSPSPPIVTTQIGSRCLQVLGHLAVGAVVDADEKDVIGQAHISSCRNRRLSKYQRDEQNAKQPLLTAKPERQTSTQIQKQVLAFHSVHMHFGTCVPC